MSDLLNRFPGLILLTLIVLLLIYGALGGVRSFCEVLHIDIESHTTRLWSAALGVAFMLLTLTALAVVSGLFVNFLGLAGLFAIAYIAVRLLGAAVSKTRRDLSDL